MMSGYVGTAPGTTTLTVPGLKGGLGMSFDSLRPRSALSRSLSGWPQNSARLIVQQQNPGVVLRTQDGGLGGHLGNNPDDFSLAKIYGYLPVQQGWVVGNKAMALSGPGDVELMKSHLELLRAAEDIKTARSHRIWAAVGGIVAVGGLVVAIVAARRR